MALQTTSGRLEGLQPEVAIEHGGTPPAGFPASEMPPIQTKVRSLLRFARLCLLHSANVVGGGSSLRHRTTRRILREIIELYLLVRNAYTLGRHALCASTHAVARDVAIRHQDLQIDVRSGGACRFAKAECGRGDVLASVQGFQYLIASLVDRAREAEVG